MATYTAAIIGTGKPPETFVPGEGAAMAYQHAPGYTKHPDCELIACADIIPENSEAFADEFDVAVFENYQKMLTEMEPDIVSICTPVPTHATLVFGCLESAIPEAIHCEKPMATTWKDARRMAYMADRRGVQLTFNHQRRFSPIWREPKELLDSGAIGRLERVEVACGELLDNGTHYIDLANMYNDEQNVEWVLCGLDYREEYIKYGAHNENHGLALWQYENGVSGLASTGIGADAVGATNRLVGTDGVIEVAPDGHPNGYRVRRAGETDSVHEFDGNPSSVAPAIEHGIDCLDSGRTPELSARRALDATEIIFGAYESVRQRGRVDFPLDIEDNPLEAMVEAGDLTPTSTPTPSSDETHGSR